MIRLMVSAPASSSGKTAVTCALLTALRRRGLDPCAFKCGPDYIDPMFHRSVLGVESHNLDLFFTERAAMKNLFDQWCRGRGAAVCEGAMGLYDGVGGTDQASVWQVADALELPVLLVVRTGGAGLTLAAQIRGLQSFRENSRLRGILLNQCRPELCRHLAPMLERETGLPVLGCLPREERAEVPSRHLGLYAAGEIQDLRARIGLLADALERHVDLDRLLELFSGPDWPGDPAPPVPGHGTAIAVARDEAFCFTYAETLETLARAGARLLFFSPLRDRAIPEESCGLYLPGGYPELHAAALAQNSAMRAQIRAAVENGMPTVAECGGFLYLGRALQDAQGHPWPMAGLLPGEGFPTGKLVRFGYAVLTAQEESLLFRPGEQVPVHEFHHWDSSHNGGAFKAEKTGTGRSWQCGFASPTLYAGFLHLYFAGSPQMAERFVAAAERYGKERRIGYELAGSCGEDWT